MKERNNGKGVDQAQMFESPTVANLHETDVLASLSAFARAFGTDRETLRRALLEREVEHVTERAGHKLYALRPVYQAWTAGVADIDPDKLKPFQRRAWYQGEREKMALQLERGQLVEAIDMERTLGRITQIYVRGLETAADVVERDCGLTPPQAARLEAHLDRIREDLYQAMTEGGDEREEAPSPSATPAAQEASGAPVTEKRVSRETSGGGSSALDDAIAYLRAELAAGARPTASLIAAGKKAGLSEPTLRRAKAQMGAELEAKRQGKGWIWQLTPHSAGR